MATSGFPVLVRFPLGVPLDAQGPALLHMEQELRASTGLDVRVVKDLKGDDSRLRLMMTKQERKRL